MTIFIKGKVTDCYEKPIFINKATGEASERKFAVQLITDVKLSNGQSKKELIDINIKEEDMNKYQSNLGKEVEIGCNLYSNSPISLTSI